MTLGESFTTEGGDSRLEIYPLVFGNENYVLKTRMCMSSPSLGCARSLQLRILTGRKFWENGREFQMARASLLNLLFTNFRSSSVVK